MIRRGGKPVQGFGLGTISKPSEAVPVTAAVTGTAAGIGIAILAHELGAPLWGTVTSGVGTAVGIWTTGYLVQRTRVTKPEEPEDSPLAQKSVTHRSFTPRGYQTVSPTEGGPAVIRQSVIDNWIPFNTAQLTWTDADGNTQRSPDEGVVPWMYVDIRGLITTGMGILIEEGFTGGTDVRNGGTASTDGKLTEQGLRAGWRRADGSLASDEEIQAEFANMKAHAQEWAQSGHTGVQYTLHLDNGYVNENGPSVQALTAVKLQGFADMLKSQIPMFDTFPADGQMGLLSHSWAMGAWLGGWPKMKGAANETPTNWLAVSQEDVSPTYAPARQASNIRCYLNAQAVDQQGLDPAVLYFPANAAPQTVV
jgi:hypothetical protein